MLIWLKNQGIVRYRTFQRRSKEEAEGRSPSGGRPPRAEPEVSYRKGTRYSILRYAAQEDPAISSPRRAQSAFRKKMHCLAARKNVFLEEKKSEPKNTIHAHCTAKICVDAAENGVPKGLKHKVPNSDEAGRRRRRGKGLVSTWKLLFQRFACASL